MSVIQPPGVERILFTEEQVAQRIQEVAAEISARYLEPLSMWTMIVGIVALLQPWSLFLHRYGVTVILIGLVGFLIFSHIQPQSREE